MSEFANQRLEQIRVINPDMFAALCKRWGEPATQPVTRRTGHMCFECLRGRHDLCSLLRKCSCIHRAD